MNSSLPPNCTYYTGEGTDSDPYVCVSNFVSSFCYGVEYGFILLVLSMVLLNTVLWFLSRLCTKLYPPFFFYLICIIQNILFSFMIKSFICHSQWFICVTIIFSNIIITLIFNCHKYNSKEHRLSQIGEIRALMFENYLNYYNPKTIAPELNSQSCYTDKDKCDKVIDYAVYNPPVLTLKPYKESFRSGSLSKMFNIARLNVNYTSWQPFGERESMISNHKINIYNFRHHLEISEELQAKINDKKEEMKILLANELERLDNFDIEQPINIEIEFIISIYGLTNRICYAPNSYYLKFLNSRFGRYMQILSMFCGLSLVYDTMFCLCANHKEINTYRYVSHTNEYVNSAYKGDKTGFSIDCPQAYHEVIDSGN